MPAPPKTPAELLGARLRARHHELGSTLEEVADRAPGRNAKWIGRVELGQGNPRLDTLCTVAKALVIDLGELLAGIPALGERSSPLAADGEEGHHPHRSLQQPHDERRRRY